MGKANAAATLVPRAPAAKPPSRSSQTIKWRHILANLDINYLLTVVIEAE